MKQKKTFLILAILFNTFFIMNVLVSCEKVTIEDKKEGKVIINIIRIVLKKKKNNE